MPTRTLPSPSALARHWDLASDVVYLNHGSFGACPREVMAAQSAWRRRMEEEPVRFFIDELEGALDRSRTAIGGLVGCAPRDLAPVANATTGVATVLANIELGAGDEVIATRHEYPACLHNLERAVERAGARIVYSEMPFPVAGAWEIVERVLACVTERTRAALVSHITSSTAMVLPLAEIVRELRERGIETIVDGAHGPGQVDVDLEAIGAAWYTANCHKWPCAPKGAAFLHVRADKQAGFRPLVLSNHAHSARSDRSKFLIEFDYVGTDDRTAFLSVADSIACVCGMHDEGWAGVMATNHELLLRARDQLCERLGTPAPVPGAMLGSMATILLPAHPAGLAERLAARPTKHHDALQDELMSRHSIEVPIWSVPGTSTRFTRISAQLYNSFEQYVYLADALVEELERERRM